MVVLHHGAVGVVRGVDAVAGLGRVKCLRVQRQQDDAARQVASKGGYDYLFAHSEHRPSARTTGVPCGQFQPFGGEFRLELDARLASFELGNGTQADQVL